MMLALRRLSPFVRIGLVIAAALVLVVLREGRVLGTNHSIHMVEVMAGANGNSKIQFIVVEQEFSGQNAWGPGGGETQSRAMLVFYDAAGRETGIYKFPSNPPTNGTLRVLIATQDFANLTGAPTPNFIIPPLVNAGAGKVCFKNNPANGNAFTRNECLSYGGAAFTGTTETSETGTAFGAAAAALPITDTVSLKRTVNTSRNVDFALNTTPTPINIANQTLTIAVSSQTVQGENLFTNEGFLGNGRTCASCHVASQNFGMTPSNVASRFATLSSTFDPQFIAENLPSTATTGFDFGLNTLTLTAAVATAAPCTGELRGVITGTTGTAKVLTRVSGTSYLVYGGRNPALSGTVTDGTCSATFQSITVGSLSAIPAGAAGLESPLLMRSSTNAEFSQGRALILENIDGFPPTAAVFRKSPHLLNLSRTGPFGFSSDVASLQTFVTDAITQHLPRTLTRSSANATLDFRLPTAAEQAAMEAFMLAQEFPAGAGGDAKFNLDTFAKTAAQVRGRTAFFGTAKCSQCHGGPVLARTTVDILGKGINVNARFNTGVGNLAINGSGGDNLPAEAGGNREFSVPQLFNAQRLGPFFHNNSVATLREAVDFYASPQFNNSAVGQAIGTIAMSSATLNDIVAFLEGLDNDPAIETVANQTVVTGGSTGALALTLSDPDTALTSLTPSATSSNTTVVPNNAIVFGGSGANRTVTVTPAVGQLGSSTITVTVSDGTTSTTTTFNVTASAANTVPTVASMANQTTAEDTATGAIAVTVGDLETATSSLTVTASSSNTTLIPNGNIAVGGSGANRTLTLTPAANQNGTSTITVTVTDAGSLTAQATFVQTVTAVNDVPTITAIAAQSTAEDTATGAIAFVIADVETAVASLTVSGSSSNPTLVPNGSIAAGGSGGNRTVTVTPAANEFGTSTITVSVNDGTISTPTTFVLTVSEVNDAPNISAIAAQATVATTPAIAFTVGDIETAAASLTASATSSNTTLVPNANIALGGSGANRTVVLTPVGNLAGSSTITVSANDGSTSTSTTFVLTVTAPATLTTQPVAASVLQGVDAQFTVAAAGDPAPAYQWQVSVNAGSTWTNVSDEAPYSGATTSALLVTAAPAGLNASQYRAMAANASGSASSTAATLTVFGAPALGPATLQFTATKNGAELSSVTAAQTAHVTFSGAASAWTATANQPWLQLTGASGGASGQFTVAVINPSNVIGTATALSATITLTPALSGLPAVTLPVTLTIKAPAALTDPFGSFDSPTAGAAVAGSISVSGWALDDVGIDRVEIWRDLVAGETTPAYPGPGLGTGKVFIANALFVSGARPDVEQLHPTAPFASQAGWGYLLLTQGLWNQGNGPFTLHAFAYDTDGHSKSLGSKSITVSNSTSVKPFGALDTPTYGQTVTSSFWNFGWALTPNATPTCQITPAGVQVAIDSGPLTPVSYGDLRTDIASAFPGFSNGSGAGGAYFIDTTKLSNGAHQIGWFVTDDCGRAEGIGSRFFTVLNAASTVPTSDAAGPADRPEGAFRRDVAQTIEVRRGLEAAPVSTNPVGTRVVSIAPGERVELQLPASPGATYNGYQMVNGGRRALPLGSTLDATQGIFYWQPGPAFLGAHDLEFVSSDGGVVRVRAIVGTSVQAVIDTPSAGPTDAVFTVAGWAIDEAATNGSGIDAVHVWAHPADGGKALFLGVASYGEARPDVGALFGGQFAASSFSLVAEGLAPGAWDLVVYPHSSVTGDFHGAQVRRIVVP